MASASITNKPFFSILLTETETDLGTMDVITEIPLDVRRSSTSKFTAQVTESPIEDGSTINDHIIIKPDVVTCEGLVSDTPVTRIAGVGSPEQVETKGNIQPGLGERRSQGAYDLMEDIFRKKKIVTIIDEFTLFDDMVLEGWEVPRSKERGQGLDFTATFKKLVTVETLTATLPPDVVSAVKRRRKKTKIRRDLKKKLVKYISQQEKLFKLGKVTKAEAEANTTAYAKSIGTNYTGASGRTK